jgi:hypothetical protein
MIIFIIAHISSSSGCYLKGDTMMKYPGKNIRENADMSNKKESVRLSHLKSKVSCVPLNYTGIK